MVALAEKSVEKTIEIGMLYDFYGELLTPRQKEVLQYYYEENYSLSEIAEELGVSRQAVHDTIHKAEKSLRTYEQKLGILERFRVRGAQAEKATAAVDQMICRLQTGDTLDSSELIQQLGTIRQMLGSLEE